RASAGRVERVVDQGADGTEGAGQAEFLAEAAFGGVGGALVLEGVRAAGVGPESGPESLLWRAALGEDFGPPLAEHVGGERPVQQPLAIVRLAKFGRPRRGVGLIDERYGAVLHGGIVSATRAGRPGCEGWLKGWLRPEVEANAKRQASALRCCR